MASLNKVMVIGNLGADPEMRFTANGHAMATFNVACNYRRPSQGGAEGEWEDATEWVRVVCWRRLAELAGQYLSKGRSVYIEGRLQTRQWEDREGNTRYTTEVVARDLQFLGSRSGGDFGGGGGGSWEDGPGDMGGGPDAGDLPFE